MRYLGRDFRGNVRPLQDFEEELADFREYLHGIPNRQTTIAARIVCWLSGYLDSHGIEAILVESNGARVPFYWKEKSQSQKEM